MNGKCETCGDELAMAALRPYGPGGGLICFPCGHSPEHAEAVEANMRAMFDAAEAMSPLGSVIIGAGGQVNPLVDPETELPPGGLIFDLETGEFIGHT